MIYLLAQLCRRGVALVNAQWRLLLLYDKLSFSGFLELSSLLVIRACASEETEGATKAHLSLYRTKTFWFINLNCFLFYIY